MIHKKLKYIFYLILSVGITACNTDDITQPSRKQIVDAVFASGYIKTENEYFVISKTEGYLQKSYVKTGDLVDATKPLFKIGNSVQSEQLSNAYIRYQDALDKTNPNAPQISRKKLEIEQAKLQLQKDKQTFERYTRLVKTNAVSQQDFEKIQFQYESSVKNVSILERSLADLTNSLKLNVQNAETQLSIEKEKNTDYFLSSNIQGAVLSTFKEQGELVKRGEKIAKIGGGQPVIKLFISEEDINNLSLGDITLISLNTESDLIHHAKIFKIYPSFDDKEQSFIVEAKFTKAPKKLFTNTQLQANIVISKKENALVIPSKYLINGNTVLLKDGNKKAIKTGIDNGEWTEVISGLKENENIVYPKSL